MIKEDHLLACTTKMFEILVALPHLVGQTRLSRVTTWIARTAQVHLSFRTHILAAIRLFTCQRARLNSTPISHRSSATIFTANVAGNFRYRRRVPRQGSRILASRSAVSTAVGELFFRRVDHPFRSGRRRHEARNRLIGSGPFEPSSTFECCFAAFGRRRFVPQFNHRDRRHPREGNRQRQTLRGGLCPVTPPLVKPRVAISNLATREIRRASLQVRANVHNFLG